MSAIQELETKQDLAPNNRMIESLLIQNFRCYGEITVRDLKTVNLIVGRNASGKTAFLEALYFPLGSPALSFKLKGWRGLGQQAQFTEASETRSGLWRDLFHNFELNRTINISLRGTSDISRSVRVTSSNRESQFVSSKKSGALINEIPPITFEYSQGNKWLTTVKPDFTGEGIVLNGTPEPLAGTFFSNTIQVDPQETANHFSNLSKKGKLKPVLIALQDLFPIIEGLSLEFHNSVPLIHASIKGVPEKMPVGLVSTGVAKMVAYLVSIADKNGGVVIIDEIENGLYYNKMSEVWQVLYKFCKDNNVQLFASTHSAECLNSLQTAMSEDSDDFCLLRTEREGEDYVIRQFSGKTLKSALHQHAEIR